MNPAWNALVARWDAARESILRRVDGVLSEATAVSTPIVGGLTSDATALQRLWQPVEAKMHAMVGEVSDTWDSISDAMSEVDGIPDGGMWLEGFKRDATNTEIHVRHGRARAAVFAQAALMMKAHAERSGDPGAMQMFMHGGAHFLAEQKAIENWAAMKTSETRIRGYRNKKAVPMPLLDYYAKASANYWRVRYTVEAQLNPALQGGLHQKIENFTRESQKLLLEHPQWRAAHQVG